MNYNPNMKDETCTCIDEHYCGKSNKDNPRLKGLVDWTIDPIKSDGRETGEVQMWADMDKQDSFWVKQATSYFELLKEVARQAIYDHPDCECEKISAKCLRCFAEESLAKAERR